MDEEKEEEAFSFLHAATTRTRGKQTADISLGQLHVIRAGKPHPVSLLDGRGCVYLTQCIHATCTVQIMPVLRSGARVDVPKAADVSYAAGARLYHRWPG